MPNKMTFRRAGETVVSEAELRQILAEGLGVPHSDVMLDGQRRFVLGETGITVSLDLDENRNPMVATAEIPFDAKIEHVPRLCRVFREMDWAL